MIIWVWGARKWLHSIFLDIFTCSFRWQVESSWSLPHTLSRTSVVLDQLIFRQSYWWDFSRTAANIIRRHNPIRNLQIFFFLISSCLLCIHKFGSCFVDLFVLPSTTLHFYWLCFSVLLLAYWSFLEEK